VAKFEPAPFRDLQDQLTKKRNKSQGKNIMAARTVARGGHKNLKSLRNS